MSYIYMSGLSGQMADRLGSGFKSQLAHYENQGCFNTPGKALCKSTFELLKVYAQQVALKAQGFTGISLYEAEQATGPTVNGYQTAAVKAALAAGTAMAINAVEEERFARQQAGELEAPPQIYGDELDTTPSGYDPRLPATDQPVTQRAVQQIALKNQQSSTLSAQAQALKIRGGWADASASRRSTVGPTGLAMPDYQQNRIILSTQQSAGFPLAAKIAIGISAGIFLISMGGFLAGRRSQ